MNMENPRGFRLSLDEMSLYRLSQSDSDFSREVVARCTDSPPGARVALHGTKALTIAKQVEKLYRERGDFEHLPEALQATRVAWEKANGERSADSYVAEVLATCYEARQVYEPNLAESLEKEHPDWTKAEYELEVWSQSSDRNALRFVISSNVTSDATLVKLAMTHPVNVIRERALKNLESRQDLSLAPIPDIDWATHLAFEVKRRQIAEQFQQQQQQQPQQGMEL